MPNKLDLMTRTALTRLQRRLESRNPKLYGALAAVRNAVRPARLPTLADWTWPVEIRRSDFKERRLNLLAASVNPPQFGGTSTAVKMFESMGDKFAHSRLLVWTKPSPQALLKFKHLRYDPDNADSHEPWQILNISTRTGQPLSVGPEDIFIATMWPTAFAALHRIIPWQSQEFGANPKPLTYLIQDYEPGFFAWSSEFLMARSTYEPQTPVFGIFNTKFLHDYFRSQGHKFEREYVFEPKLNSTLARHHPDVANRPPKKKQILIYGRPNDERNGFGLINAGLREWRARYSRAGEWELISAGTLHDDVDLGGGITIKSVGTLSLDDYARVLRESAVGVSVMVSPHPSYPPLEMAHFGLWVITTNFATKNMADLHDNFLCLDVCTPTIFANAVIDACERFESDNLSGYRGQSRMPHFTDSTPEFPFMNDLVANLTASRSGPTST